MYQKRRVHALDTYISYIDTRAGEETILFLHGSPSYSFTWRNVIPRVDGFARCLAPDLVGMGDSARDPTGSYSFMRQYSYLDAWIKSIHNFPHKFIIVGHDWGAALGALWISRNPERAKAFVHMEGILAPFDKWDDLGLDPASLDLYKKLTDTSDKESESKALEENVISDAALNGLTLERKLSKYEEDGLRRPSQSPHEARKSALAFIRQLPIRECGPDDVINIVEELQAFMENSGNLPKLYIHVKPGQFSEWIAKKTAAWPNQDQVNITGKHFPQEDDPENVGNAVANFVKKFVLSSFGSKLY